MSYQPMTADEASKLSLRPEGIYSFEVTNAEAAISKEKKNPMIALTLNCFDAEGNRFSIKDWLVHSDSRFAEKKVYEFALHTGLAAKYAAGALVAEDCLGRTGWVKVGVQAGKPKADGSGNFPDRNSVKYYCEKPRTEGYQPDAPAAEAQHTPAGTKPASANVDEDVPF